MHARTAKTTAPAIVQCVHMQGKAAHLAGGDVEEGGRLVHNGGDEAVQGGRAGDDVRGVGVEDDRVVAELRGEAALATEGGQQGRRGSD